MYKEKLQEIISESFIKDKINSEKFIKMTEKVEKISESKAEKIISELWGKVAVGAVATGLFSLAIWRALKVEKMNADKDYKKCINYVDNTLGKRLKRMEDEFNKKTEIYRTSKGEESKKYNVYARKKLGQAEDAYNAALEKCEELYDKKIEIINKKKKEVRLKFKAQQAKK